MLYFVFPSLGANWQSLAATFFETFLVETLREENKYSFLEKLILRYESAVCTLVRN